MVPDLVLGLAVVYMVGLFLWMAFMPEEGVILMYLLELVIGDGFGFGVAMSVWDSCVDDLR